MVMGHPNAVTPTCAFTKNDDAVIDGVVDEPVHWSEDGYIFALATSSLQ
jgi:hypothetical protein